MNDQRILHLCARPTGTPEQYSLLRRVCDTTAANWESLLHQAERQGMIPLLHQHLKKSGATYPVHIGRNLTILERQLHHRSMVLTGVLHEVSALLAKASMHPIFLKGSVLRHTVYKDPRLRPMRDIDLLLTRKDAETAQKLLIEQGFEQSKIVIPADHFHLLALSRRENGVTITIEIHHGLYPPCPPWYKQPPVADFVERGKVFDAGGRDLLSMGDVDMLRYLYQHAIRTPLVYESFRLINIADIIGQVETCFDTIDWRSLGERYPQLLNGLPLLHRVVPWRSDIAEYFRISRYNGRLNRPPHSFNGWPTVKFRQQRSRGGSVMDLMRATFFPSLWWLRIYYGVSSWVSVAWCLLVTHPRHILWWYHLHYAYLITPEQSQTAEGAGQTTPLWLAKPMALLHKLAGKLR
ncbi:MAG: nucleotidyltransferase family protein [Desulfofustis sp. PB-SRB1]|nr:nucleotidyltransferase family protein [Desulfofustis sp. PB-SRB1]